MKVVARLVKPFTEEERENFIVEQNHTNGYKIEETSTELQALDYTDEELTEQRKAEFESKFLETSLGWYRLQPKGYANAQQSIDTINSMVGVLGSLTQDIATMVLFYQKPDFTKPEECTEEWLVQHQYSCEAMDKIEWTEYYVEFTTLYARKMYQQQILEQGV